MELIPILVLLLEVLRSKYSFLVMFYLLQFIWQDINIHVVTICFSLSSASPAHTPKEEYVITQSTDTTKEEPVHDQTEDQGEPQEDRSEPTERKSVPGCLAAEEGL